MFYVEQRLQLLQLFSTISCRIIFLMQALKLSNVGMSLSSLLSLEHKYGPKYFNECSLLLYAYSQSIELI
jgi:hypothetical protein